VFQLAERLAWDPKYDEAVGAAVVLVAAFILLLAAFGAGRASKR